MTGFVLVPNATLPVADFGPRVGKGVMEGGLRYVPLRPRSSKRDDSLVAAISSGDGALSDIGTC
jgi:hypothetical protein